MSKDKFVRVVRTMLEAKGVHLTSSKESALNELGREYEGGGTDVDTMISKIQDRFSGDLSLLDSTVVRHLLRDIGKSIR